MLKLRSLSAPAVVGEYVVVADLEGYVHWFDRATGALAGRTKSGGDRVTNAPVAVDGIIYVIRDKGDIVALHGTPVAARAANAGGPPACARTRARACARAGRLSPRSAPQLQLPHAAGHRDRRAAERRQVHAVQHADENA